MLSVAVAWIGPGEKVKCVRHHIKDGLKALLST